MIYLLVPVHLQHCLQLKMLLMQPAPFSFSLKNSSDFW